MSTSDTVIFVPEADTRLFKQICIWRAVSVNSALKQTDKDMSPDLHARLANEQRVLKDVLKQLESIL